MKHILSSTTFNIFSGLALLSFGIYDLYEEFLDPSHVHAFIFIAILLMISAVQHVHEGLHKILGFSKKESIAQFLEKCSGFFEHKGMQIAMSSIVLVAGTYGVITNVDEIYYRSMPMTLGMFMLIMPLLGVVNSTKTLANQRRS